jgi:tetratricopeptide (TPR) repeat protein
MTDSNSPPLSPPRPSPAQADSGEVLPTPTSPDGSPFTAALGPVPEIPHETARALPAPFGRYELRELLGEGGMGSVYLAHDTQLDRPVALKLPRFADEERPQARERFLREARAAAGLRHPNICPVYDAGELGPDLYLSMAYVEGEPLSRRLRREGPLPAREAATLARAVALAMDEAHRHGVIHRDLKPSNVMLDLRGQPVVMDFGLARRAGTAGDVRLTGAGSVLGTPQYMSPEQAAGDSAAVGPASDVYSLGVILYEMLTGQLPFRAETTGRLLAQVQRDEPPPPRRLRPDLDPRLEAVCLRALAKEPGQRFATMAEFAEALAPFAEDAGAARTPSPPTVDLGPPPRRWRWLALAAGALVLALLGGAALYVATDTGTVEITLSDPAAGVKVEVDGNEVPVPEGNATARLRVGKHLLTVTGADFETETRQFWVKRGEATPVEIRLRPRKQALPEPRGKADRRQKLAWLLHEGRRLVSTSRFREGLAVAEQALKIDPKSPGALAVRGTARAGLDQVEEALADCAAALKANPETALAYATRAILRRKQGRAEEAIVDLTVALRLEPYSPRYYVNRAHAFVNLKEFHQAVADCTAALNCDPRQPKAYHSRAVASMYLGRYDEALADLGKALALSEDPRSYWVRSVVYTRKGNLEKAREDRKKAEALDPTYKDKQAIPFTPPPKRLKKVLSEQESARVAALLAQAEKADQVGAWKDVLSSTGEILRVDPDHVRALELCADAQSSLGQTEEARRTATRAVQLDPNSYWAYGLLSSVSGQRREWARSIAYATISLGLKKDAAFSWNNRSWAYYQLGYYHQAVADATEGLKYGKQPLLSSNRAAAYLGLGQYAMALEDMKVAIDRDPLNPNWYAQRSALHSKLGNLKQAQKDWAAAVQLNKGVEPPRVMLPDPLPPPHLDPELKGPPGGK